jgi:hypothetical protein
MIACYQGIGFQPASKGEGTHDDKDADRGCRANRHVDGRRNGARCRQGRNLVQEMCDLP